MPCPGDEAAYHETPCTVSAVTAHRGMDSEPELREIIGPTKEGATAKISDRLNHLTRQFIERSPFVCVATARPDGGLDVSPRGDPAGFVRVLDERTLLLPERPGNRIADTLTNLLSDPRIALLFLIPGIGDTFRVNGRAALVDDAQLLRPSAVEGKVPRLGILISVEEAYTQCPKALIRSDLWNPEHHIARSELPSPGEILRSLGDDDFDADGYDKHRAARYARREGFY
jgi:PPOX class probable FMN-dependent enzyme